jgi:hypothetical protein
VNAPKLKCKSWTDSNWRTRRSTEGNLTFGDITEASGTGNKINDIPENTRKSGYKTLEGSRDKNKHKPKREKPTDDPNDLQKVLDEG